MQTCPITSRPDGGSTQPRYPSMPSSDTISNAGRIGATFPRGSALTWLFLYRMVLASMLVLAFSFAEETPWLSIASHPTTARLILGVQAALILVSGLLIRSPWPSQDQQIEIAVFLDIIVYTLLMHLSGGVSTGLGLLPAIAVIAGAILLEGKLSLLFASLATLAVITQQVYSELYIGAQSGTYTQAGLLGLTYFAVALLVHVLSSRLRETERLAARRKVDIADLSKLNEQVIKTMSMGVLVIDGERNLVLMNDAARRMLHIPNAAPGDPLFVLSPALRDWFARERAGRNPADSLLQLDDAELRPTLHLLGQERMNGAMIYLRDNREMQRQAQEMKLASLGRLTASIAHNIRNPLSSVTHAMQLLAESDNLDDDDRHLLGILRRNALRIDETVNSVLALSRRREPDTQTLELGAWLEAFCDEYRENHPNAAEQLRLEISDGPLEVRTDPRHLGQILRNLCDNAFQHAARDSAPPLVRLSAARDNAGDIVVAITDDGPGIAAEHVRDIFEPFFTTSSSGTGLGLYAARELAQANAIRLSYRDDQPTGARFSLTFAG
jgi:two-component system sensor histidine kinase PilS (NtrC family)